MSEENRVPEACETGAGEVDLIDEMGIDASLDTAISVLGKATVPSPLQGRSYSCFVSDNDRVLARVSVRNMEDNIANGRTPASFELAGPRRQIYFNPEGLKCAIVTCGGLCPGINDVIRSIVLSLNYGYGVKKIYGIRYGLRGFVPGNGLDPVDLTVDSVNSIHEHGGTVLGSSRGPQPVDLIVDRLVSLDVSILFIIGGDGTFRAGARIAEEVRNRGLDIAIVAVPKTIDNDIYLVSKTFGFDTAVEMACQSIRCAHTEAIGAPNCVGLVKVMGRYSGFIAAAATAALREVNFCLIPESDFDMDGPGGFLDSLEKRLKARSHAVVVVAEGAGQKYVSGPDQARDPSGNVKLGDIGLFMRDRIKEYFASVNKEVFVRYIDPSYIIRSVPANVDDRLYCGNLGQNAVHAAMAGKTAMMVSYWNDRYVHVPLMAAVSRSKRVNLRSRFWMSVLESTGQSSLKAVS